MLKKFSPNMLKTYEICPKKFHFKYVKNISMPVDDTIFETGKNIHALASYYLKKEDISNFEIVLNDNEKLLWEYLKNIEYFSYECVNTEYNLSFKLKNFFFGGRLDALVKKGETYYILDYKTGGAPKGAKYDYQTMVYLLAAAEFYQTKNVTFVYIDLKNKKETLIELTDDLIDEYKIKLLQVAENIEKGEFRQKNSSCPCEYDIICY